jgi:hypothetical protein
MMHMGRRVLLPLLGEASVATILPDMLLLRVLAAQTRILLQAKE